MMGNDVGVETPVACCLGKKKHRWANREKRTRKDLNPLTCASGEIQGFDFFFPGKDQVSRFTFSKIPCKNWLTDSRFCFFTISQF